jgi:hypothetical protein
VFCLLAATACDEKFTLAPGDVAAIEDTGLRVQFVSVTSDSRCPADAICVWAGDAVAAVRIFDDGGRRDADLHTHDQQRTSVVHGDLRITLVQLQPYPFSSRPTQPSDYRATLEARR